MANIIIAPSKYVQGKGEMKNISNYTESLGKSLFYILSPGGMKRVKPTIEESHAGKDSKIIFEEFRGECSTAEIDRLIAKMEEYGCDVVVGVGGGKILDTAKAVAYYKKVPVVIVPTIASTDAPCSALSVIYSEEGVFEKYLFLPANPNLVLVDTDIVSAAPVRLLVSGMGDALATYFEAKASADSNGSTCAGGKITKAALALAELCYNTLIEDGLKAKLAAEKHVCTKAVENVIEANTYLSGIGFESGGLAGAHAIHNGLTVMKECHEMYHGEKVAFGTLTQLMLQNAPNETVDEVVEFCLSVGLPVTLEDLGVTEIDPNQIMEVAKLACAEGDTMGNMPLEVTPEKVYAAILAADAVGHYYKD